MNTQVKRALCLERIYSISTHTVESSGRHIKATRHYRGLVSSESEQQKCDYALVRSLNKHVSLLQESIINSAGKTPSKKVDSSFATRIITLTKSPIALTEGNYSYVDVDSLRNMNSLKKAVTLKKDVVLPVKVKSQDEVFKFNVQIVLSKNTVLSYASNTFSKDSDVEKLYRPVKIERLGKGIKNNELIEKAKSNHITR